MKKSGRNRPDPKPVTRCANLFRKETMRTILATAALAVIAVVSAPAVQAQAAAQPAAPNAKLAGSWEGNFSTDGPSGTMTMSLTKGSPWKVTSGLSGEVPPPAEPRDLVIDGDKVSWKQMFGEYDVTFKGQINAEGTQVTGTLEANQGGTYVGGGSFTLNRKP